jgi:hypothetical protein
MAVLDTAIFFHPADARIKSAHDVSFDRNSGESPLKSSWPDLIPQSAQVSLSLPLVGRDV